MYSDAVFERKNNTKNEKTQVQTGIIYTFTPQTESVPKEKTLVSDTANNRN